MTQQIATATLSRTLKPLCPRDNHEMHFEPRGIESKSGGQTQTTASYHCDFEGCSVRYTPAEGYFTVIDMPDLPHFVEEPGANLLQCPGHGTWLFRCQREESDPEQFVWQCGVEGCDYLRADVGGHWISQ